MLKKALLFILLLVFLSSTVPSNARAGDLGTAYSTDNGAEFMVPHGWTDVSVQEGPSCFQLDDDNLIMFFVVDLNEFNDLKGYTMSRSDVNKINNFTMTNQNLREAIANSELKYGGTYVTNYTSVEINRDTGNDFIRADALAEVDFQSSKATLPVIFYILYKDGYLYEFAYFASNSTQLSFHEEELNSIVNSFTYPKLAQEPGSSMYDWIVSLALLLVVAIIIFFAVRKKNRKKANQSAPACLFCRQCGTQLPDEALFCPVCGHDIKAFRKTAAPEPLHVPVESAIKPGNIMSKKMLKREVVAWVFLVIQFFFLKTTFQYFPSFDWNAPSSQVQYMGNLAQTVGYLLGSFLPGIIAGILFISVSIKKRSDEKNQEKSE